MTQPLFPLGECEGAGGVGGGMVGMANGIGREGMEGVRSP